MQKSVSAATTAPRRRMRPNERNVRILLPIPHPSVDQSLETVLIWLTYPKRGSGVAAGQRRARNGCDVGTESPQELDVVVQVRIYVLVANRIVIEVLGELGSSAARPCARTLSMGGDKDLARIA